MDLLAPPGTRLALMGNEAIARGILESGVGVITGYPGTPSSEVIMTLQKYSDRLDIYMEWAVNERVAFEIAYGSAIAGIRSMVTMKAPGLNVASDPLLSAAYAGVNGGLVVLVADDPGPHTTQTEQDSRWYGKLSKAPIISPATPQEAKDYTKIAFELSELTQLPFILRTTTRVSHSVGDVVLGEVIGLKRRATFKKDPPRYVRAGMKWNLDRHKWLNKQLELVEEISNKYKLNTIYGNGDLCIVTEGVASTYVTDVIEEYHIKAKVIKLALLFPFPSVFIKKAVSECSEILVVEELDPYIEENLKEVLYEVDLRIPVKGKKTGHIPLEGELNRNIVKKALGIQVVEHPIEEIHVPPRPPPLCPGCPHRFTFIALKIALSKLGYRLSDIPIIGDIGCYALSVYAPLEMLWTEHSMGASISMSMGLKIAGYDKPVIAVLGDSTFYHAGIQSLVEAVNKKVDVLVLILDNNVVAMTGHQSTPAWSKSETGRELKPVKIEEIVKSIGPTSLVIVDPYDLDATVRAIEEILSNPGVKVIIARHPCALLETRYMFTKIKYKIDEGSCKGCKACIISTGCPAIIIEGGKAFIVKEDCNGCGLCARFCASQAIKPVKVNAD